MYDVIIIGSGPAGLMAAANLKNKKVLLIERNKELGKKLLASGNGRCNVTNNKPVEELIKHYKNGRFLFSALTRFSPYDIMDFFESEGVPLKEEDHNRMFPASDRAQDILSVLMKKMRDNNVEIIRSTSVEGISIVNNVLRGVKYNGTTQNAKNVIIATGGFTFPSLGTTGDAYSWLASTHEIVEPRPTESPLVSNDLVIRSKELQGLAIKDAIIKLDGNVLAQGYDLLFTHFGLSGPLAFRCSDKISDLLQTKKNVLITLDTAPNITLDKLAQDLRRVRNNELTRNAFKGIIPNRLMTYILEDMGIENKKTTELSNQTIQDLAKYIKDFPIYISDIKGVEHAYVTNGGVSTKDIDPKTFESKKVPNLYVIGELLDVHAHTGGFNITAALSMGYSAAMAINEK